MGKRKKEEKKKDRTHESLLLDQHGNFWTLFLAKTEVK